jgi:hypothetical protein
VHTQIGIRVRPDSMSTRKNKLLQTRLLPPQMYFSSETCSLQRLIFRAIFSSDAFSLQRHIFRDVSSSENSLKRHFL